MGPKSMRHQSAFPYGSSQVSKTHPSQESCQTMIDGNSMNIHYIDYTYIRLSPFRIQVWSIMLNYIWARIGWCPAWTVLNYRQVLFCLSKSRLRIMENSLWHSWFWIGYYLGFVGCFLVWRNADLLLRKVAKGPKLKLCHGWANNLIKLMADMGFLISFRVFWVHGLDFLGGSFGVAFWKQCKCSLKVQKAFL